MKTLTWPKAPCIIAHASSTPKLTYHPSSSLEIQLPLFLHTPDQKLIKPLKHTSLRKKLSYKTKDIPTIADILRIMEGLSLPIPPDMFSSLIKECTVTRDSTAALHLHAYINNTNFKPTLLLLNRLLLMHVSCGQLSTARQLFDQMTHKDFNSWAIMIVAYIDQADYQASVTLFGEMMKQQQDQCKARHILLVFPAWIIVAILKACVYTMNVGLGKQVHALLLKLGSSNKISATGSLINFYGKFRCLEDADLVFNQLNRHSTVVWTAKIVNNCREGKFYDVLDDFNEMTREGTRKNNFTFSSVLKACARMDDDGICGQQVHANAIKIGLDSDVYVHCGLVDMYGKHGLVRDAKRVFEMISDIENIASWNAMLVGYIRNGFCVEAIKLLYQMKAAGLEVQESLIKDVRIACGSRSNILGTVT